MEVTNILSIACVLLWCFGKSEQGRLHSDCCSLYSIKSDEVDKQIQELLGNQHKIANVIKVLSWKFSNQPQGWSAEVCRKVKQIKPLFFSMQHTPSQQLDDVKSCLSGYSFVGADNGGKKYSNPIFYENNQRIRLISSGVFSLSDESDNPKSTVSSSDTPEYCSWMKISYTEVDASWSSMITSVQKRLFTFLRVLTGKEDKSKMNVKPRRRHRFRRSKTMFVANAQLDGTDIKIASRQIKNLLYRLKRNVMDRRRYPIILTINVGVQDNSVIYKAIKNAGWLHDTMSSGKRHRNSAISYVSKKTPKDPLTDFIFQNKFKVHFSAVVSDDGKVEKNRPVVAVMSW